MRPLLLVVGLSTAALLVGCDRGDRGEGGSSEQRATGKSSARPSFCPDTEGPFVRGRVFVPVFPRADAGADQTEKGIAGGRRERPAGQTDVVIYRASAPGETLASTRTDAKGRWCVGLEASVDIDTGLLAEARIEGVRLRSAVFSRYGQHISVRSEALIRILEERVDQLGTVSPALYLNAQSMASTAADLLTPVRWRHDETLASAVERVRKRISRDERVQDALGALETEASAE